MAKEMSWNADAEGVSPEMREMMKVLKRGKEDGVPVLREHPKSPTRQHKPTRVSSPGGPASITMIIDGEETTVDLTGRPLEIQYVIVLTSLARVGHLAEMRELVETVAERFPPDKALMIVAGALHEMTTMNSEAAEMLKTAGDGDQVPQLILRNFPPPSEVS